MRKILKVTSILGIATIIKILSGIVRVKFLAWYIGPAGLGIIGQALMYSMFTIQLCSLNMSMGITKGVSENIALAREDKIQPFINTAWTFQLMAAALLIMVALPFSGYLTRYIFSDDRYRVYFILITLAAPFAIYLIGMVDPIFYGFRRIAEYTKLMILYTLIGLALVFILVYFFKTEGMMLHIVLMSLLGFFLSYHFIRRKLLVTPKINLSVFKGKESRDMAKGLFQYSLISFIPAVSSMVVLLYLRGLMIKQYGIEANGFYQVAYGMSSYYLSFVTNALWGHFYPAMCAIKEDSAINHEINQFIRFILFVSTAIAAGFIIFRKYIILLLFSPQFMKAYDILAIQAIGDIFFMLFCMFSTAFMARKRFGEVVWISAIAYNAVLCALYFVLTRYSDLNFASLNVSIALTNVILVVVYVVWLRLKSGFILSGANLALFAKSLLFIGIVYLIPNINTAVIASKVAVFFAWLIVSSSQNEKIKLTQAAAAGVKKTYAFLRRER